MDIVRNDLFFFNHDQWLIMISDEAFISVSVPLL